MDAAAEKLERRKVRRWLLPILGYAISLGCLIWVYRGFDWKTELPKFAHTHWRWLILSVAGDITVYFCQGWRWSILLRPVARVRVLRSVQAVFIGLLANEILPFRSGEVVRSYLQARWAGIPFSVVASSAVVERLFDGIWLVLAFLVITSFHVLPKYLVEGSRLLGLVVVLVAVLLGIVMFYKHHAHAAVSKSRWSEMLWHVVEGLHAMGNSPSFYGAAGASFLYLALQVVPIYALMRAYGLNLSIYEAAVVLVILRLGTILPLAPSNIGSFQASTRIGLRLFGVRKAAATGFATLLFIVVTVPLWLGGFIALAATGMKLGEIHRDAHSNLNPGSPPATRPQSRG